MLGNTLGYMATTCMILLVGGCAYLSGSYSSSGPAATAQMHPRREDYSLELPADTPMSENKAVLALLSESERQAASGKLDNATANLERALHIEPRNAYLYNRLAQLRLKQERFDEAAAMAAKSNSLGSRNAHLQERNWRLIAEARRGQGDQEGADFAEQRANQLREFIEK